jgi:uncharacterized membrane protein (DUF485 family)
MLAELMAKKRAFLIPTTIFFLVYYFALPILCGYAPELMATKVVGAVNVAYLLALSNFVMAWVVAGLYVRKARTFDELAERARRAAESGSAK